MDGFDPLIWGLCWIETTSDPDDAQDRDEESGRPSHNITALIL